MWWSDKRRATFAIKEAKRLLSWVSGVDNWAHSDSLSCVLARVLEDKPSVILPTLKKWNKSKNPWERRQSVVALLYYASQRSKTPDRSIVFTQVERLLEDPHFYVQKGVGWTLREAYRVWPKAQVSFVKKNLTRISGTAWFATSEKYPLSLKRELVAKRKLLRKKK
jgi:3-methyladenine DNA glycosylase AlkD